MTSTHDLDPLRAMLRELDLDAREKFVQAAHGDVYAPVAARKRRSAELGFLARLLEEEPQSPERLPSVQRKTYTKRRSIEAPDAPTDEWLWARYGSWRHACYAAWGVLEDGSKLSGTYEPRLPPGLAKPPRYTAEECSRSVELCADAIGHFPSSTEYHSWQIERTRRAKERGRPVRLPRYSTVLREIAPERGRRDGWKIVRTKLSGGRG